MGKFIGVLVGVALSLVTLHAQADQLMSSGLAFGSSTGLGPKVPAARPAIVVPQKNRDAAGRIGSMLSAMSGSGQQNNPVNSSNSAGVVSGDCSQTPSSSLLSQFNSCKNIAGNQANTQNSFLVDTDNKIAFVLSPSGSVLKCVPVMVGAASTGNPATLGTDKNETRQGLFLSQRHSGERYQTDASDPAKDAIGIGDISGRIIHSSHGNRTTAGCIGIVGNPNTAAGADAAFLDIKKLLGTNGAPVFVHGSNYGGCGDGFRQRSESTEAERQRRKRTTPELDGATR